MTADEFTNQPDLTSNDIIAGDGREWFLTANILKNESQTRQVKDLFQGLRNIWNGVKSS